MRSLTSCRYGIRRALTLLLLPVMMLPLAGCPLTLSSINTTGTTKRVESALDAMKADLCKRAWLAQSYSKARDSAETVAEIQAKNAGRAAYCGEYQ